MFSKHVGGKDSIEEEVLAILEALKICLPPFQDGICKSALYNAISRVSS